MSLTTSHSAIPDYLLAGDSDELSLLLQQSFPRKHKSKLNPLDSALLVAILKQHSSGSLIDTVKAQLKEKQTLSDKDFSTLHFVDQLFHLYRSSNHLHEHISDLIDQLRPIIAIPLIQQDGFILDSKHSAQQCISIIQHHTLGWQPEEGRAAERYIKSLQEQVKEISEAKDAGALLKARRSIQQFFEKDLKRIEKIEQRLRDTELGRMRSLFAHQTATLELNKRMSGHELPEGVIQFLHSSWLDSLKLAVITYSQDSDDWQHMLTLTERLIASFEQTRDNAEILADIPEITAELKTHTLSLIHSDHNLKTQLSIIAAEHFKIMQGDVLEYKPFRLLEEDNPLTSSQAQVSRSLIKEVEKLKTGQWFFLHKVNQQPQRIRLSMKSEANSQLLFINQLGLKVEVISFENFAYKLSSRIALPIEPATNFHQFTLGFIGKLFTRQQEKQDQKRQAKENAKRDALKKDEERIEARAKAIAEATLIAEAEADKRQLANQSEASQLTIGSWIEFDNENEELSKCRLAAKIQTTNVYVFVNRNGQKQDEIEYKELLKRLNNNTARIIKKGDYVDDPLASIVGYLRKGSGESQ